MKVTENKSKGTVEIEIDYSSDLAQGLMDLNQMNVQGMFENDIDASNLLEVVNFLHEFSEVSFKMNCDNFEE